MHERPATLRAISSMATRQLLGELGGVCADTATLQLESVGGVDASRRVRDGEVFDLVFLAADALAKLAAGGQVVPGSIVNLVRSQVAVAVKAGSPVPAIDDVAQVKAALLAAPSIGYSTGPSGSALLELIERMGLREQLQARLLQAPAGIPVAALVARGEVALGFQQRSEMQDAPGITVVGDLPTEIAIETTFAGAVCTSARDANAAAALLVRFAAPEMAAIKQRHGMSPA